MTLRYVRFLIDGTIDYKLGNNLFLPNQILDKLHVNFLI